MTTKVTNNEPWPIVIKRVKAINGLDKRLGYIIEHQPYLPLRENITDNAMTKLEGSSETTIEAAIKNGIDPQEVVIGFYLLRPWTWLEKHTYWNGEDRAKSIARWISGE